MLKTNLRCNTHGYDWHELVSSEWDIRCVELIGHIKKEDGRVLWHSLDHTYLTQEDVEQIRRNLIVERSL